MKTIDNEAFLIHCLQELDNRNELSILTASRINGIGQAVNVGSWERLWNKHSATEITPDMVHTAILPILFEVKRLKWKERLLEILPEPFHHANDILLEMIMQHLPEFNYLSQKRYDFGATMTRSEHGYWTPFKY